MAEIRELIIGILLMSLVVLCFTGFTADFFNGQNVSYSNNTGLQSYYVKVKAITTPMESSLNTNKTVGAEGTGDPSERLWSVFWGGALGSMNVFFAIPGLITNLMSDLVIALGLPVDLAPILGILGTVGLVIVMFAILRAVLRVNV